MGYVSEIVLPAYQIAYSSKGDKKVGVGIPLFYPYRLAVQFQIFAYAYFTTLISRIFLAGIVYAYFILYTSSYTVGVLFILLKMSTIDSKRMVTVYG